MQKKKKEEEEEGKEKTEEKRIRQSVLMTTRGCFIQVCLKLVENNGS